MNKFKKCIFIILGLCFVSCSAPSLFEGLDLPDTELISTYEGEKLIDELSKNINSKSFYQELTQVQKQKILSNLDKMIFVHPKSSEFNQQNLIKAASFAIEILIYTDSLSYAVIYDLTNPLLVLLSGQNISPQTLFEVYIQPIKEKIQTEGQNPCGSSITIKTAILGSSAGAHPTNEAIYSPSTVSFSEVPVLPAT